ncbi:MAG: hypothetical protein AB7T49_04675 [Oligoflexales bacterium]
MRSTLIVTTCLLAIACNTTKFAGTEKKAAAAPPPPPPPPPGVCSPSNTETLSQTLNFPASAECAFNQNGNLDRKNGFHQAISTQTLNVPIPANIVLCEINIESSVSDLRYDDFLIFTLDKYVLVGSNGNMMDLLQKDGNLYIWNFDKIKGQPADLDDTLPPYCIGASCDVPGHDQAGPFNVNFTTSEIRELANRQLGKNELDFSLITTGDDNDGDCEHTEFNLSLTLRYSKK